MSFLLRRKEFAVGETGSPTQPSTGHVWEETLSELWNGSSRERSIRALSFLPAQPGLWPGAGTRQFGDYELIEQLGCGGMGVIYKARQLRLNRLVAIKMINAGEFASPMLVQRFHREAEAAANLNHPNIVPIYETGELRGQHFFSMQLVDGAGVDRNIARAGFHRGGGQKDARSSPRRPLRIHLHILKSYDVGYDEIVTNGMAFGRVGPSSLIHLINQNTGVRQLAMQDHKNALIMGLIARIDSPVAQMSKVETNAALKRLLAGRSVALGNSNSTTGGFVARAFLVENDVFAPDLAHFQHLESHGQVIDAVRSGKFDVGFVNVELIHGDSKLVVVRTRPVSEDLGRCFIAGPHMDDQVFMALQNSLLRMRDPAIIGKIEVAIAGFKLEPDSAFDPLRVIMRAASAFDSRTNSP